MNVRLLAELRPLGFAVAYRMLGSVSEAEDIVQEAFLRLHHTLQGGERIESPFLLCGQGWVLSRRSQTVLDRLVPEADPLSRVGLARRCRCPLASWWSGSLAAYGSAAQSGR